MNALTDAAVARLRDAAMWPELPADRYVDLRRIASGGMGTVYAARDTLLDRDVAIKVSNTALPMSGETRGHLDRRLADESKILASLEHPGIVPVHDAGTLTDGRTFYVMKLVNGHTLAEGVAHVPELSARLSIFDRIVETVSFAHAAGVVHRDIKPSNIMIGSFGEVLVLDWGVARIMPSGADATDIDQGFRLGTPGFSAPELQDGGAATAGPAADVFSLGTVLHGLVADAPRPKKLDAIINRCRSANPADRYPSADVLRDDLIRYHAGQSVSAYRDTVFDKAAAWLGRHKVLLSLIAAYLLMRVAFLLYQRTN